MRRFLPLVLLLAPACGEDHGFVGDGFPIQIETANGPLIAHVSEGSDGAVRTAVVDVSASLTVLDAPADAPPARRFTDLTFYGADLVPRAHLDLTITAMHACDGTACVVGPMGQTTDVDAIVGGDAFDTGAARFDLAAQQMFLFPDIAGDDTARAKLCEAEVRSPFRGGGTIVLAGSEVSFGARRIALGACASYETGVPPTEITEKGANLELILSTAIGVTVLTETAYNRWRDASGMGADLGSLTSATVMTPFEPLTGKLGTIDRLAIVGDDNDGSHRGPCRLVYAHHLMTVRNCKTGEDCPCGSGSHSCSVPAVLELAPADPIPVLIVPDETATIQALRAELRPDTAEIDGIVGTDVLAGTSFDVDPPDDRLLFRCQTAGCTSRPALITPDTLRPEVQACLDRAAALTDAGVP